MKNVILAAAAAVVVAVVAACLSAPDAGAPCTASADCEAESGFECVAVKGDGICLPVVDHEATSCTSLADCDAALFPLDAQCTDGRCQCDALPCTEDSEGIAVAGKVLDRARCACVDSNGAVDDFCNDTKDCQTTLQCVGDKCALPTSAGDDCVGDFGCAPGLTCFCPGPDPNCGVGSCEGDSGFPCSQDRDCHSAFCSGDVCE